MQQLEGTAVSFLEQTSLMLLSQVWKNVPLNHRVGVTFSTNMC